jgi:succinate dehydrogenase/fumarate reductase flavoprotein subunit
MMAGVTEDYERQLWEELNSLLADAVPENASEDEAERAIMLALMGNRGYPDVYDLHQTVQRLAREGSGYLREKLEEDNPVSRARRRLYGKWA